MNQRLPSLPRRLGLALAAVVLAGHTAGAFPILTNVVEFYGDNEPTDTIVARWTGVTWLTTVANEPTLNTPVGTPFTVPVFGEDVPAYVDRAHEWNGATVNLPIPNYLLGGEYIMIGNDNRDNNPFQLDLYVAEPCVVFMLVDWRNGDAAQGGTTSNTDPPFLGVPLDQWVAMTWLGTSGFQPVTTGYNRFGRTDWPDEVGVDEVGTRGIGPGVEIQQYSGIYYKLVNPGPVGDPAISLYESAAAGQNMYGVVVTPLGPDAPTGLQATSLNGRLALRWNAARFARSYVIKRSSTPGGPYTIVATNSTTSYTDSGLVNDQPYYYVVSGLGMFAEGPNSAEASGTPKLAPETLVAVGGTNQISLSWAALIGAANYTVKRSAVAGGPYTAISIGQTATTYLDPNLPDGQRYYYTVSAALGEGGDSADADEASAVTAPAGPATLRAERFAATVIRLTWTETNPEAASHLVERSSDGENFSQIATVPPGVRTYLDAGLPPDVTRHYRVRANNSGGYSAYTAAVSATTPASGINVNFAFTNFTTGAAGYPLPGFLDDYGFVYGPRGNGYSYGWDDDNTQHARLRNAANSPDKRYDTFNHLQKTDPLPVGRTWEIAIPNGLYLVHIVSGDASAVDSVFHWDVEGYISVPKAPAANDWWRAFPMTVRVEDGRLTLNNGPQASNNKICWVDIYPTVPMANTIATHPQSQVVTQNQSVTFTVVLGEGPEPVTYQWRFNGNPIADATASSYTIPNAQPSDQGTYSVLVANAGASVTSSNATLTVITDIWPPTALSAGSVDGNSLGVCFSEPLDSASIYDPGNYLVNGQAGQVWWIEPLEGGAVLRLHLLTALTGNFTVGLNNLKDLAGNTMPNTVLNGILVGLTATDIGGPGVMGESFTCDGLTVRILGGGSDIWNLADQFHYAYRNVTGDFDARVRLHSLTQSDVWAKAGIMAREDTYSGARNVMVLATPLPLNNLYQTQWRDATDGGSASAPTLAPVPYPNARVKLIRQGNRFSTFVSTDGLEWRFQHTYTPTAPYPAQVLVGLALTSHNNANSATGVLSGFSLRTPLPDVALAKSAASAAVMQGGVITYTLTVDNLGADAPAVVVTDPLPAGVTYDSSVASVGTVGHANGTVTWTIGALPSGATATLTLNAIATTGGSKVNTATAVAGATDDNPSNNTASATVLVLAPPALENPSYADGQFTFSLATVQGLTYLVQYTDELEPANWLPLATIVGDGTVQTITDPNPAPAHRYYQTLISTTP